jgi:hypothetical protein
VAILEHGQWKDRKFTQRDMQFAELRNLSREVIREAFGFPKPMTGAVDDVNRANGDSGERMFARWLLVPDLEAIRDALNHQLLPLYGATGQGLEFDFVNPVPDDVETESKQLTARANAAKALADAGVWDPDDILSAVGLPEMRRAAAPAPAPVVEPTASWDEAVAGLLGEDIENAQRWVVKIVDDGNTCHNCREQDGRTYKNRQQAYEDYPGGEGYVRCEGVQYGNACRCKVVKRGRKGEGS